MNGTFYFEDTPHVCFLSDLFCELVLYYVTVLVLCLKEQIMTFC